MEASGQFLPEDAAKVIEIIQSCKERDIPLSFHLNYFGKNNAVHFALTVTDGEEPKRVFLSGSAKGRVRAAG